MLAGVHPQASGAKKTKMWESFVSRLAGVRLPVVLCRLDLSSGAAEVVGRVSKLK